MLRALSATLETMGTCRYICTFGVAWVLAFVVACGDNNRSAPGDDTPVECTAPNEIACGGACVNMFEDESNCGSCGNACRAEDVCLGGSCQIKVACEADETACNNVCKPTQTDEQNCGACGTTCGSGQICVDGACEATVACTTPQVNCNNDCVDTTSDEANCGGCGNACAANQTCVVGQCLNSVTCTLPQIACNNVCVDPTTDEANCGGCGTTCTVAETCTPSGGTGTCLGTTACTLPQINCNNACVDPRTDEANCGGCGTTCAIGQSCAPNGNTGTCQGTVSCTPPQVDCDNACVDTQTDDTNCGACGTVCSGATPNCVAGTCSPLCSGTAPDLCGATCTDVDTDEANCGTCGTTCAADEACTNGLCADICTAPTQLCSGQCLNTQTDSTNCGGCGIICGANTTCQGGTCQATCAGQVCNGNCVDPNSDPNNCGSCGNACTGGKVCGGGTCGCPAGTVDCNGTCKNLTSDDTACGACGTPCAANENCVASTCELDCTLPQLDCGGAACVDSSSDDNNCGACGTQCTGFFDCQNSQCVLSCPNNLPDQCAGTCKNFQTDNANCGSCGNACPSGQLCSAGTCQLDCMGSTTLCNGACVDFSEDEDNCGTCGNACSAGAVCSNGTCACPATQPDTCPGLCTDFDIDEQHCGNCQTTCSGTQTCDDGICCTNGTANCNGQCLDLDEDENNCGACGTVCDQGEVCDNGSCACPFGQAQCPPGNGACKIVANDPTACGPTCEVCSGQTPYCVSNGCAAQCPAPLEACGNQCVNTNDDNTNCGTCGTTCAAGTGCSNGACVPKIVVGPDPAKCVNGGPPIVVPTEDGDTCTGSLGAVTFRFGLCSCTNIGPLGHDLLVDAFDSSKGPYLATLPERLGGGIGVNGTIQNTATIEAYGDFWVFGAAGQATKGPVRVHDRFFNKGRFDFSALVSVNEDQLGHCSVNDQPCLDIGGACPGTAGTCMAVGEDAMIGGAIDKTSGGGFGMVVSDDLRTGTTTCAQLVNESVTPNANVRPGDCIPVAFDQTLPPPCDCTSSADPNQNQLIPVRAIVANFADPTKNDNALIGLSTQALVGGSGAQRLDLPCGNYYLDQINVSNATTIVVHGRTGLYIGGSVIVSQPIIFDLDPDATLDIFVAGVVKTSQELTLGSPAYPRLSRMYVGSAGCSGSGSCSVNADCCSGICQANGVCAGGGGGNVSESFSMSGSSFLNGLMYSGHGTFRVTNPLIMNGAVFANYYDSVQATIHFDKGASANGDECPPPDDCDSCQDCNNQACIDGQCAPTGCTDSSQCCQPLQCVNGSCQQLSVN